MVKHLRRIAYLLIFLIILVGLAIVFLPYCLSGFVHEYKPPHITVDAWSAIIIDAETGRVLYDKNPDIKLPPASTTKVMTAIVALDHLSPDAEITPSKKAIYVEPTVAGLKDGVKYKFNDLLAALLIKSSNDAAVAIAEAVGGNEKAFAKMMNEKAAQLGMTNTRFESASGLPTGKKDLQFTTARDLAKMMRYAARNKTILTHMSKKDATISGSDDIKIYLKTHNKTLTMRDSAPWGKTGYTRQASRTFTGVDPSMTPKIAFALLKSEDLWNDILTLNDKGLIAFVESRKTWQDDLKARWGAFLETIKGDRGEDYIEAVGSAGVYSTAISTAPTTVAQNIPKKKHRKHRGKSRKSARK